jgi:hypothetical protein
MIVYETGLVNATPQRFLNLNARRKIQSQLENNFVARVIAGFGELKRRSGPGTFTIYL